MSDTRVDRGAAFRRLVAGRSLSLRTGTPLESIDATELDAVGPNADAVLDRVTAALDKAVPREQSETAASKQARDVLLGEARHVCQKLDDDPNAPLDDDEITALEAIILIDGTRPSLPILNDTFDPDHPFAGIWRDTLAAVRVGLREQIKAVGRIEPQHATSHNYLGTGWVVDSGRGLVLTNRHVVEQMHRRESLRPLMIPIKRGYRIRDGIYIDFACESGSARTNRFRVVEARVPQLDGPWLRRLDAAVLTIEPTEARQQMPAAIQVRADADGPRGRFRSFCAIGFPGPTQVIYGQALRVDWNAVYLRTFGQLVGVKRISPGKVHLPLGGIPGDERRWAFGHDLTTMRGSSGSPLIGWLMDPPMAFGLHFGGQATFGERREHTNYAHSFAAAVGEFRNLGVPVRAARMP